METNFERMKRDLEVLATYTSTPGKGVTRSSYSKEDKEAREYLIKEMKKLGLQIYEDGVSTLFGRKEGTLKDAPVVMIGSHYDSVVHGGAFDGPAGCIAALEVMRILDEEGFVNDYPIELLLMNAEEGATFGSGTGVTNSRAMVGNLTIGELETAKNRFGQTKLEAMKEYGLIPDLESAKKKPGSVKNYIELHVEQGPILEYEGIDIGLVGYLPGIGRCKVCFHGEQKDRKQALKTFTTMFNRAVIEIGDSVDGEIVLLNDTETSSDYKVEIRTFEKEVLNKIQYKDMISKIVNRVEEEIGAKIEFQELARINYPNPTPPSVMDENTIQIMEKICDTLGYSHTVINEGTGHDAMIMTDFTRTNMIYVPSKGGFTHCPEEWTDYEDIKKGADVLLHLVMDISKK